MYSLQHVTLPMRCARVMSMKYIVTLCGTCKFDAGLLRYGHKRRTTGSRQCVHIRLTFQRLRRVRLDATAWVRYDGSRAPPQSACVQPNASGEKHSRRRRNVTHANLHVRLHGNNNALSVGSMDTWLTYCPRCAGHWSVFRSTYEWELSMTQKLVTLYIVLVLGIIIL